MNETQFFELLKSHSPQICDWGFVQDPKSSTFKALKNWILEAKHLPLHYLADHRLSPREDLAQFYPEFKEGLVLLFSYAESRKLIELWEQEHGATEQKIASYTLGFDGYDYHLKISQTLHDIAATLQTHFGTFDYKLSIDIHPVMDRDLAFRAGLGFYGKNSMLISRKHGSFTIIAGLLFNRKLSLELTDYQNKKRETDHCGHCTKCADACPTQAIDVKTRTLHAKYCISTYTIEEFKDDPLIERDGFNLSSGYIFGCDICQDVCPWNIKGQKKIQLELIKTTPLQQKILTIFKTGLPEKLFETIKNLSQSQYRNLFHQTSFARSGKRGLLKNLVRFIEKK